MKIKLLFVLLLPHLFACSETHFNANCTFHQAIDGESIEHKNCASIDENGQLKLSKNHLKHIRWTDSNLACVYIKRPSDSTGGWFFLSKEGIGRETPFTQDLGCQPFKNGLAIGISKGKVVYFDRDMKIIRQTLYAYSNSFQDGFAKVCTVMPDKITDPNGETYALKGGKCGYINTDFELIIDTVHSYESIAKPN